MEDTIVIYTTPEHLNTMAVLAKFISKHHPSVPIILISTAAESAAASIAAVPSITYHRLPLPEIPPSLTKDRVELFFELPRLSNPNLRLALQEISQKARIRAFVIDFFCNAAFEVSTSLSIPTFYYFSSGSPTATLVLHFQTLDETIPGDLKDLDDFVEIPGLPPIYSLDIPVALLTRQSLVYQSSVDISKNLRKSAGFLVNGFDALEFRAKEAIVNGLCVPNGPTPPVYFIGPLVGDVDAKAGGEEHECLRWLDTQPSKSVIFLCFGRRGVFSAEQLKETAVALENSGHRFLWSVRNPPEIMKNSDEPDLDELLPEGFLERTKDRGFVIKSWAPQKEVLSHDSVGGFVTHCGRSSISEGVWFGVPMIGWPVDAEQKLNRTVLVEEMQVALPMEEAEGGFVTAAELEKRVRELMESKVGKAVRQRVGELKCSARAAVTGNGSSLSDFKKFLLATRD
uniref:Glycosyltransferase n=1 Tax=Scutellaria laeteviolacea var. yakusimensis TaxID=477244 RepID=B2NID0_9LAMI|nr:UGT88D5 [Scutellaria laeteviolacea var. yakusimensis]